MPRRLRPGRARSRAGRTPTRTIAGSGTRVTLLLGVAELAEEIDVDRARVALEAAEARLAELGSSGRTPEGDEADPEVAEAEGDRLRAQTRLDVVQEP